MKLLDSRISKQQNLLLIFYHIQVTQVMMTMMILSDL